MSDIGAEAVAAVYSALSDAQVQLRYAGSDTGLAGTITTVIGTGIEETRQPTDEGLYNLESATARYAPAERRWISTIQSGVSSRYARRWRPRVK